MRRLSTFACVVALGVAIVLLVQRSWPTPANAPLRQTLDRLRASPVPVVVVVPQQPRETSSSVEPDGYTYTIVRGDPLIVRGRRSGLPDSTPALSAPGEVSWTRAGTTYTITAVSDLRDGPPAALMERVTPLDVALRQNWGFAGDTPLLYLLYVPLLAGFAGWACLSLVGRAEWRHRQTEAARAADA